MSKLSMYSFNRQTPAPAVDCIWEVGYLTMRDCTSTVYTACTTRHSHVTDSQNINNSWDTRLMNEIVHTEL